jgi:hypothetical protein
VPTVPSWPDPIDHVLALDPGARGIAGFFTPGAALAAARALVGARKVLITSGFTVQAGLSETDGPPGAAVLGRALRRLGARVRYVTDPVTVPLLEATLKALDEPPDVFEYPEDRGAARQVLAREQPTHLVAIERPGRSRSGDYLNARGVSVAEWNRPIDELFVLSRGRGASKHSVGGVRPVTIGVGDGGNEVGMGNVRARLAREGPLMARIACVVPVDHLVVAGTSNWGAYGIVAALARLTGQALLHSPVEESRLVEACVEAGGGDGLTRRRQPTVDALPLVFHAAVVTLLGYHWSVPPRPASSDSAAVRRTRRSSRRAT